MDSLYRLTFLIMVGALFCVPSISKADYTAVRHFDITHAGFGNGGFIHDPVPDHLLVCNAFLDWLHLNLPNQPTITFDDSTTISSCRYIRQGFSGVQSQTITSLKDCSDGLGFRGWDSAPGGTGGRCLGDPPPEPEACEDGRELDSGFYSSANNPVACIQGCQALRVSTGAPVLNCDLSQGIGVCNYIYPARYVDTGVECSPSSEPPKETPKPDCPYCRCMESGGSWGQVGGVDTCMPQGSAGSAPVTKPAGPPTVTTTTPAPTPENPDPEPVIEVTPAPMITVTPPPSGAPAGTPPTVTETTTDPETGSTITTEKDKKSYCEENPAAQICRDDDKSVFTGSCEAFRCEGDAIQCAMALKQHQTVCDMQKGDAISDLGQQLMQGQGGVENPLDNPEQVSLDSLDTSSFMPKGGLQDMSFSIVGQSFTLPLSNLNAGLQFAGYIVLAFSFIAAARIVFM